MLRLSWCDEVDVAAADSIRALVEAAADGDGVQPVSERVRLRVRPHAADGSAHLLATEDGRLVGYANVEPASGEPAEDAAGPAVAELVVHPASRRRGVGTAVVAALLERVGQPERVGAPQDGELVRVWAHGEHPGAVRLAEHFGFRPVRRLLRMRRALDGTLPQRQPPDGVRLRTFVVGQDEQAVVEVNRRAFSWHPEQGGMTLADVAQREAKPWFDPAGFLLAVDESDRLLGFHWTKIHRQPDADGDATSGAIGEVYVVGVDPVAQGGGLGATLTLAGLHYLRSRGLPTAMLYVEGDNDTAVTLYEKLGFTRWDADVQFAR